MTITRISFIAVLIFFFATALSLTSCSSPGNVNSPDSIKMTLTIDGLQKGEEAALTISHEIVTVEDPLFVKTVTSNGEKSLTINISTTLKDGFYQLLLEAPGKYFRDPKGYFFMVSQSQIVNPTGRNITFNLLSQPEGLVAEAYISLSAPPKVGGAPPPPFQRSVVPEEATYLPGEWVDIRLSLTNTSPDIITISSYPPEIQVTPWKDRGRILFSRAGGTQPLDIKPGGTATLEFTWDQKDKEGKQATAGWYAVTYKDINIIQGDSRITSNPGAAVLIRYPQGALEKTIELEQSQTVNGVTVTLERVELATAGMTVYAFGTLPNYKPPPAVSPFMYAFAEFSVSDNAIKLAGPAGRQELENGVRLIWSRYVDPVPSDAKELTFSITTITLRSTPDKADKLIEGPWEFRIPLE